MLIRCICMPDNPVYLIARKGTKTGRQCCKQNIKCKYGHREMSNNQHRLY